MAEHTTTEATEIATSKVATDPGTGGDLLVEFMREAGVEVAFGVISIHNIPLIEAVDRELRFVPVRHEASAINAADGYARATGGIGVAITSTGTGAGNAAGAMLEALTAGSRVLHVTGNIDKKFLGEGRGVYHEVPRQLDMLRSVSRHTLQVEKPKQAARVLAEAMRLLDTAPTGPVSIDWPIDLQYTADPAKQAPVPDADPKILTPGKREIA
ncbi:MAG: thiamine pyrophosphate-binding protein, partial [Propionibacteriaceae bacterium]|nr:thiamine pyrophosphate-binding protein [Propionibacteriaceae bacterium]